MKILSIISRDLEKGSTKYRIGQYADFLKTHGINIEFIRHKEITSSVAGKTREFDLIFNQKCLMSSSLARKIFANSRKTIFDFDDAIYTRPGKPHSFITNLRVRRRFDQWLKEADIVTTANQYLAARARQVSSSVVVIPMAVDTEEWRPADGKTADRITIGWAGAPVNVPNIERLDNVLSALLNKNPSIKLTIFSGEKPKLSCPFEYHPYISGMESSFMHSLDIGLLPLNDEEFTRGKSPIKAIQYMACGIPVVGNIFGATKEILNPDNSIAVSDEREWIEALETLIGNHVLRKSMGRSGRQFVLERHNMYKVRERLLEMLLNISNKQNIPRNFSNKAVQC